MAKLARPERFELPTPWFVARVYYHKLGTSSDKDILELGNGLPAIAAIRLQADAASGRVIARVQDGDGGQFQFFVRSAGGNWRQFGKFGDGHQDLAFGPNNELYLVTRAGAARQGGSSDCNGFEPDWSRNDS